MIAASLLIFILTLNLFVSLPCHFPPIFENKTSPLHVISNAPVTTNLVPNDGNIRKIKTSVCIGYCLHVLYQYGGEFMPSIVHR